MIDAHCHLPSDLEQSRKYLAGLRRAGVTRVTACAVREEDWGRLLQLAGEEPGLSVQLGIHPWFLENVRNGWQERLAAHLEPPRVGIGEIGLDRLRGGEMEGQLLALRQQLQLAWEHGRPASLHCVRAWGRLLDVIREFGDWQGRLLVHGFAGSPETGEELLRRGCILSLGAALLTARGKPLDSWLPGLPLNKIRVESDASSMEAWGNPRQISEGLRRLGELVAERQGRDPVMVWKSWRQLPR